MMTAPNEWIHIAGDACEFYSSGVQYTVHKENDHWIARSFSLSHGGDAAKKDEESAPTIEQAQHIVHEWESRQNK